MTMSSLAEENNHSDKHSNQSLDHMHENNSNDDLNIISSQRISVIETVVDERENNESSIPMTPWPEQENDDDKQNKDNVHRSNCLYRSIRRFYQRWTYSYMNSVLIKGGQQDKRNGKDLTLSDLFLVPSVMQSKYLSNTFRTHFHQTETPQKVSNDMKKSHRLNQQEKQLLYGMWKVAAPTFVPAGVCQFVTVLCQTALPLTVRKILQILETTSGDIQQTRREGIPYAVLLFVIAVANAFANHRHRHLALKSGIALRSTVVTVIYQNLLYLSPAGKEGLTSGEVNNLVATDTQKLFEVAQEAHYVWSLPLSILLVAICLLTILGPTTIVGMAVLVMFVPIIDRITRWMLQIRRKRILQTDQRVGIVNAMLQGIKVTKLNSYEDKYLQRTTEIRNLELFYLRSELALWALTFIMTKISPVIATGATFALYVLIDDDNILTASKTFSLLLFFTALRFPINFGGKLIGKMGQAFSAVQRVSAFLERDLRVNSRTHSVKYNNSDENSGACPLLLKDAVFYIGRTPLKPPKHGNQDECINTFQSNSHFRVSKFNLTLSKGEVLAVCGPVGSGKSVFINGIIDELPSSNGSIITTSPNIAYISQDAFIINNTLRENILFGRPYEPIWYNVVIDACGLRTDIELFGRSKDLTEIGERGITLSGGQKQRVSLARGVYAKPDLLLLDDPLSALDAGTSKLVFERVIKGPGAILSNSAVVLVTHAAHFLNRVDRILIIVDGENKFLGTWEELCHFKDKDVKTKGAVDHIRSSVQEVVSAEGEDAYGTKSIQGAIQTEETVGSDKIMTIEERRHGLSSLSTWLLYFHRAGGFVFLISQIIFMTLDRFAYVLVEWWLAWWTNGAYNSIAVLGLTFPPQTDGRSAQYQYLRVYCIIMFVSFIATIVRTEWAVTGGAQAAKNFHAIMLDRILEAPMSYFEQTPMGRIINRFTFDTEVIDVTLTEATAVLMFALSWIFAGIVILCTLLPWMLFSLVPVCIIYLFLASYYRKSGPDLQRLDAISRSPIQAMLVEGMEGGVAIRLYNQQETFLTRFQQAVDSNSSAMLNLVSAQRWLGVRVELLGSTISLVTATLVVALNNILKLDPGLVGLLIMWSSNFTLALGYLIDSFAESEAAITSIERVDAMSRIPQENTRKTEPCNKPPTSWPEHGQLEFDNVCMRYRPGLPLALSNLSFKIPGGKKCGVVGRTGSGKSSLCSVLFRLVEAESGKITIDGVDLSFLGLSDVRGRPYGMSIIPQDPFLIGSTLRQCIDPFGQSSDDDVLECLKSVRLAKEMDGTKVLDSAIEEGGSNFSVGERQLLNLARALLSKPKILVLDEATASIDGETDAFIQSMLRTKFSGTTQITVAHRLNTIMDFDYVLVMDHGRAAEMGSPAELLLKRDGLFSQLVDATGPEGSNALRAMVQPDIN